MSPFLRACHMSCLSIRSFGCVALHMTLFYGYANFYARLYWYFLRVMNVEGRREREEVLARGVAIDDVWWGGAYIRHAPSYRSDVLNTFIQKLDSRCDKNPNSQPRKQRLQGSPHTRTVHSYAKSWTVKADFRVGGRSNDTEDPLEKWCSVWLWLLLIISYHHYWLCFHLMEFCTLIKNFVQRTNFAIISNISHTKRWLKLGIRFYYTDKISNRISMWLYCTIEWYRVL